MTDATEYTSADLGALCQKWLDRIKASEKREDDWRKDADRAEAEYLCGKAADEHSRPAFNIVHSNVETIVPSIYNSAGKPDIRPRHNLREDQVAKQAADLFERAIMTNIDDSRMDAEVEAMAQDAFWVGMQFDIGNHWKYGSMGDWIRQLGRRVFKLDVKGFSRDSKFTRISEGDIDYTDVRKALQEINFYGWLAAEVGGGDANELKRIAGEMDTAFGLA